MHVPDTLTSHHLPQVTSNSSEIQTRSLVSLSAISLVSCSSFTKLVPAMHEPLLGLGTATVASGLLREADLEADYVCSETSEKEARQGAVTQIYVSQSRAQRVDVPGDDFHRT